MNILRQLFIYGALGAGSVFAAVDVVIEPEITLSIDGLSELDRTRYFNIATGGTGLGKLTDEQFDYYINELGISFGRHVNLLSSGRWGDFVREDPKRPGYVDLEWLEKNIKPNAGQRTDQLKKLFPENLNAIGTENFHKKTWPDFMETRVLEEDKTAHHPMAVNVDAAAEGLIAYLQHGFTDWTRPQWFEGLNEPDWFFVGDQDFAEFHLKALSYARAAGLDMKVGGPCFSTGQFFRNNYQHLVTFLGKFIDDTRCELDFYSFHPYNYMVLDEASEQFVGRYTAGLPIDGVLDGVANFTQVKYGRAVPIVVSEYGSYVEGGKEEHDKVAAFAKKKLSGEGWEWEMKKRSIHSFMMVNGAIGYTMSFLGQPHAVEKSVPYILFETSGWKPDHYAAVLVSENYEVPAKKHTESRVVDFYKFFKDVRGRRVKSHCPDPDVQHHAFVDGDRLIVLFNNLADTKQTVNMQLSRVGEVEEMKVRRLGRNADLTPYFAEKVVKPMKTLTLAGDESVAIFIKFSKPIVGRGALNDVPCYGDQVAVELNNGDSATFNVTIPDFSKTEYGIVRVAISRPHGTDREVSIKLNGKKLKMPMEDCADRIDAQNRFASQYGSLKYLKVDKSMLKAENNVEVLFPDGKAGGVGSVVIRAGQRIEQ